MHTYISDIVNTGKQEHAEVIITGDFNATNAYKNQLNTLCNNLDLDNMNETYAPAIPTHKDGNILDITLTSNPNIIHSFHVHQPHIHLISDHYPTLLQLHNNNPHAHTHVHSMHSYIHYHVCVYV